jgi:hypothetical protein
MHYLQGKEKEDEIEYKSYLSFMRFEKYPCPGRVFHGDTKTGGESKTCLFLGMGGRPFVIQ